MINILITASDCANPALANTLTIVRRILLLIQLVGPIVLIISLLINITKGVTNPDEKKTKQKIINSVISIIVLFITPALIDTVMTTLGENFTVTECWKSISTSQEKETTDDDDNSPKYIDQHENDKTKVYSDEEYE